MTKLRVFPQFEATEKMAMYLQNFSNLDIDFLTFESNRVDPKPEAQTSGKADEGSLLEPHCFHAYCAALRGLNL